ncbi:MAG: inositol monophosphatase [Bacteroidales bacterium]|jgi:myo-inositol-1(or 4)-monophosphatase|nr:inositol monophosphatase [Bacteroidales bacterium]
MTDYRKICSEIEAAAAETAMFIVREAENFDRNRTERKGFNDFVSYVDRGAEMALVEHLSAILPEAGFITEEGSSSKKGEKYCFVIDPLDGTTNFVHGLKPYAISVGLLDDDKPVVGVIHAVGGNEVFTAWKNGGAWLNGKRINISAAAKLSDSLVATGFPYYDFERLDNYLQLIAWLCKHTHGIRRFGSASIDIAYVACGRFDVFFEYGLHLYDIAAGITILREAGGKISDFSGNENGLTGSEIIASNNTLHSEFLQKAAGFGL